MNSKKRVAILVADGFEQSEMTEPKKALDKAGFQTTIVSPVKDEVIGWSAKNWGQAFKVDLQLDQADPSQFDALLLPGGVMNPDTLRMNEKAVNFVKHFVQTHKPIASICHGPWTLINADGVRGKTMTSYAAIKIDLINAGAKWIDSEVAKDEKLVTSRKPDDIPAFNQAMLELFSK